MSMLRGQANGFEGVTVEAERTEGSAEGQVVLYPKEAPVSQPVALVQVAVRGSTPLSATLGPQVHAGQDAIIANRCDKPMDRPVVCARTLLQNWTRNCDDLLGAMARAAPPGTSRTG